MTDTTRRVATGVGWLYAYRWGERLLDLISIVVLARLLTPDDFGLVAIAASVVAIIEGLSDFDVNKALIRTRDEDRSLFDSAWTLSALRGLLAAVIMVVIALLLPEERVAKVVLALALAPLLRGLSNPRFVLFERELVYSKLAGLTLGAKLLSFAVTLWLAIAYRSYWALVCGILVGALATVVLSYVQRPYRPRATLARAGEIFAFSGWMSLTTMVTTLSMETDKIIVGRILGVADAGLYFMTQKVGVLPTRELVSPLQRLLFPSFSEIAADRERLRRAVLESASVLGTLGLAAGFGFALVAADFVPLALGEQWLPIVPLLTLLTPFLGLRATLSMTLPCVMALGRTRLLFRVSLIYALVHVPLFIAGTWFYGLIGAIGAIVLAGLFYVYLSLWLLHKTLGIGAGELFAVLRRSLVSVALMVASLLAVEKLAPGGLIDGGVTGLSWLSLVLKVVVGAAVVAGVQYALWRLEGRPPGLERRLSQLLSR